MMIPFFKQVRYIVYVCRPVRMSVTNCFSAHPGALNQLHADKLYGGTLRHDSASAHYRSLAGICNFVQYGFNPNEAGEGQKIPRNL
jgi:hypothetical protein